jgi:uncharacterized protein (DUF2147 family)
MTGIRRPPQFGFRRRRSATVGRSAFFIGPVNRDRSARVCPSKAVRDEKAFGMMRGAALGGVTLAAAAAWSAGATAAEPSALGDWARGDGKARVRIERCERGVCVINTWIKPGTSGEKVGDRLLISVARQDASALSGEAWDPQRRLTYSIRMDARERTMTTQGCWLAGLLCKSMTWTRIGDAH